ncbi:hypothetical protein TWF696_006734 [Orbilia brochopaga]|uniref:T6SS Phospholipase effector Tle1-like catalytic domain-containing protein n=1 Tax=Orbilia brochopaga TaxID=3140254 RepID=A0AAV9UQV6_9PEZI
MGSTDETTSVDFNRTGFIPTGFTQTGFTQTGFVEGGFADGGFSQGGLIDTGIPVAPKRLIICCDGTWQSSVSGLKNIPSNVTRLARSIARSGKEEGPDGKVWQQIVHYDAGIGTGDLSNAEKDRQGGFGIGFVGNVIETYNFLVLNYSPGDQIFCFGFSRGAYTARAVAGLVNDIGIIAPRDLQDFPDLYALYQKNEDSQGFRKSKAYRDWVWGVLTDEQPPVVQGGFQELPRYRQHPHCPAPEASRVVEVVGVFDTVGSLGIPDLTWTQYNLKFLEQYSGITNPGFHNVSLSPYIRRAFHALALDEHRGPFSPTLWHFPPDGARGPRKPKKSHLELFAEWDRLRTSKSSTEEQLAAAWGALVDCEMYEQLKGMESELQQVWFPGVHINIGGGSDDLLKEWKSDFEQIALITFAWMCEQVAPYIQLSTDLNTLAHFAVEDRFNLIKPVLDRIREGEKDYGFHWAGSWAWKALDVTGLKKAEVRKLPLNAVNGWATGPIIDSFEGKMKLAGGIDRLPGRYTDDYTGKKLKTLGPTYEYLHPCIQYRKEKDTDYKPKGLVGFTRGLNKARDGFEWVSEDGLTVIPEFVIKPSDRFTRHVAMQGGIEGEASDFIANIDRKLGFKTDEADWMDRRESGKLNAQDTMPKPFNYSGFTIVNN